MIGVALKGLAKRRLRAVLTAFAIVLGVAMVSGTYVLTDTVDRAFSNLFSQTYAETDARITGKAVDINFQGESAATPGVQEDLLADVRALPAVALAAGTIVDEQTRLLDKQGEAIAPDAPTFAFGVDTRPELARFNPTELVEGGWPSGPQRSSSTRARPTAKATSSGGRSASPPRGPSRSSKSSASPSTAASTRSETRRSPSSTCRRLRPSSTSAASSTRSSWRRSAGVSPEQLVRELEGALPDSVAVQTGAASAQEETEEVTFFTDIIRYFLLAFAGIALFVGGFVIFNTLSITVAQRTRELATLRTIGASRRQVLGSVVLESVVIGFVSALIGLALGIALALGLKALFAASGAALPEVGLVLAHADRCRLAPDRRRRDGARGARPRHPGDARAADRRGPRGSRAAEVAARVRHSVRRRRHRRTRRRTALHLAVRRRDRHLAAPVLDRRRLPRALRRRCDALVSPRPPARGLVGWPAPRVGGAAGKLAQGNARRNPAAPLRPLPRS